MNSKILQTRKMRSFVLCFVCLLIVSCASKEDASREYLSDCTYSDSVYCVNKKIDLAILDEIESANQLRVRKDDILKCLTSEEYAFSIEATKQKIDALSMHRPGALKRVFMFWTDYHETSAFSGQARLDAVLSKLNACTNPPPTVSSPSISNEPPAQSSPSSDGMGGYSSSLSTIGKTRYGDFSIDSELTLHYGGKKLDPEIRGNSSIAIAGVYRVGERDISVVQINGGAACPALFHFIETNNSGARASAEFGTCSDLIEVKLLEAGVSISMPDMGLSQGAVQTKSIFTYVNGEVTVRKE